MNPGLKTAQVNLLLNMLLLVLLLNKPQESDRVTFMLLLLMHLPVILCAWQVRCRSPAVLKRSNCIRAHSPGN